MAYKWSSAPTATVSYEVGTNENGNIATGEDAVTGNTKISMKGIKTESTFPEARAVFGAFVEGIVQGSFADSSGKKLVEYTAVEE